MPTGKRKRGFENDDVISHNTLSKYFKYFRDVISQHMGQTNKLGKIGGPGYYSFGFSNSNFTVRQ